MNSPARLHILNPEKTETLIWIISFFAIIIFQITLLKYVAIEVKPNISVQPDIILLMLFFFGLRFSQNTSTITGFLTGLVYDMLSGGIVGLSAFTKTIIGFILGFAPNRQKIKQISQFIILLFTIVLLHDLLFNMIYVLDTDINYWSLVLNHSLPSSIYTVFLGVIVFFWLEK